MKNRVRLNQRLMLVLVGVLTCVALYSLAGRSDQLDQLTAHERQQVVARW